MRRTPSLASNRSRTGLYGWLELVLYCTLVGVVVVIAGQGAASQEQVGAAVAVAMAIPILSVALHELDHVLAARAQGLMVLNVLFKGTGGETRVAMPLGAPPRPPHLVAAVPVTAALAVLGLAGLVSPPQFGPAPSPGVRVLVVRAQRRLPRRHFPPGSGKAKTRR